MVELDTNQLYARGMSPQGAATAVLNQNPIIPAGPAKIGDTEYDVKLNSSPDTIGGFNFLPVRTVNGVPVYVKDVAHALDGFAVQTNVVRRDGRRAVLMTVLKAEGASTISLVQRLREAMPHIQAQLPPELTMEFLFDRSVFVQAAVQGVLKEGAIAAGLTALMILLFLGSWRSTLIVAVSIPLSILTSIVVPWALGQSLNIMTLGGMALAVGILVDDATVELENTCRFLGMKGRGGATPPLRQAILDSAAQIAAPAFVSPPFLPSETDSSAFYSGGSSGSLKKVHRATRSASLSPVAFVGTSLSLTTGVPLHSTSLMTMFRAWKPGTSLVKLVPIPNDAPIRPLK
jgi:multidrug efflux pump subunit AcrB